MSRLQDLHSEIQLGRGAPRADAPFRDRHSETESRHRDQSSVGRLGGLLRRARRRSECSFSTRPTCRTQQSDGQGPDVVRRHRGKPGQAQVNGQAGSSNNATAGSQREEFHGHTRQQRSHPPELHREAKPSSRRPPPPRPRRKQSTPAKDPLTSPRVQCEIQHIRPGAAPRETGRTKTHRRNSPRSDHQSGPDSR